MENETLRRPSSDTGLLLLHVVFRSGNGLEAAGEAIGVWYHRSSTGMLSYSDGRLSVS